MKNKILHPSFVGEECVKTKKMLAVLLCRPIQHHLTEEHNKASTFSFSGQTIIVGEDEARK